MYPLFRNVSDIETFSDLGDPGSMELRLSTPGCSDQTVNRRSHGRRVVQMIPTWMQIGGFLWFVTVYYGLLWFVMVSYGL